ncbi:MAG TPA: putative Na+/H+ antiporter, partial [Pseudobdellovibrionaceae bacterium]|nr:putative Na+/H+ antiporter [Pseudobdellovibrionaceae bacterium]
MSSFSFTTFEAISSICFFLAILHTFMVKKFQHQALRYPEGSVGENLFHLLGEIEVVFGLWAGLFMLITYFSMGGVETIKYLDQRNFTEPLFVFVIMTVCSTDPILSIVDQIILGFSRVLPLTRSMAVFISALVVGPLLGSFITEPAAMTVTALFLLKHFYNGAISERLKYATLGLLFVNVSIGGTLTPYAAPPVLMVAGVWGWDLQFMLTHFGFKAILATVISAVLVAFVFKKEFKKIEIVKDAVNKIKTPLWVSFLHLFFLGLIIMNAHHDVVFMGLFLFFIGVVTVTKEYQSQLKIKESLLVAFFLGGLVVLGGPQKWWL